MSRSTLCGRLDHPGDPGGGCDGDCWANLDCNRASRVAERPERSTGLLTQMKDIRDGRRANGLSETMRVVIAGARDEDLAVIAEWLSKRW